MTAKKPAKKTAKKPAINKPVTRKRKHQTPPAIATVLKTLPASDQAPEVKETPDLDGLTNKQRVWLEQYLRCWNATEAARRAGYSDPEVSGWNNKQNQAVKAAIAARLAEHKLSADEVLARLSDMAQGTMGDFIGEVHISEDGLILLSTIDLERARAAGKLHLIKSISITDKGIKVELYDAKSALELLGKHYELFSDNKPADRELLVNITNYNEMLEKAYGHRRRS